MAWGRSPASIERCAATISRPSGDELTFGLTKNARARATASPATTMAVVPPDALREDTSGISASCRSQC